MITEKETVTKTRTEEDWRKEWGLPPRSEPPQFGSEGARKRNADASASSKISRKHRSPMAHRGPRVLRTARELSWRSPMLAAVLAASFAVSLLCLYIAAYARVTAQGYELSRLKRETRIAAQDEDLLRADISRLTLRGGVAQRAASLGLTQGTMDSVIELSGSGPVPAPKGMEQSAEFTAANTHKTKTTRQ